MNYSMISYILGWIFNFEAAFMLLPGITAIIYREKDGLAFLVTMIICLAIGIPLIRTKRKNKVFHAKEGAVTVALSWLVLSIAGALPFVISGSIPHPVDALFETVSGFTTTGASILSDVESLSHCILLWRSFTHWIGGMGVLVFILCLLPLTGGYHMNLMKAESPGPSVSKLVPKVQSTAKILYTIYILMTVVEMVFLLLGGMPLFDTLCLSFGTAGNNRINSGLLEPLYSMASNTSKAPEFNGVTGSMLEHGKYLYNPDLKWETTITRNLGIDFGFWNNRISGTLDFYWNTTKDLLMETVIPSSTGYETQFQNFGKTSNKGVELAINAVLVDKKNFGLNFNFNISYNRNKIEELNSGSPWQSSSWSGKTLEQYEDFRVVAGGRLGELWGYKTNGYYTVYDPATGTGDLVLNANGTWSLREGLKDNSYTYFGGLYPGVLKVQVDENGDPIKQRLGNTVAPTTGGFGFDGRIGNFDFNVFFNYSLGNKLVNGTKLANSFYAGSSKNYNLVADFNLENRYTWIDPETGLNLGRPSTNTIAAYGSAEAVMARLNEINQGKVMYNPAGVSKMYLIDYAVEDASFLRVQNITVGYTLPKKWVKAMNIENIRLYFTGYNLFCITGYDGYDPEVDTSSKKTPMCPGIDYAAYPKSRTFVGGINVTF